MNGSVEGHKHILETWLTESVLPLLSPHGVWAAPNPAPLTAEEVEEIFGRIAKNDAYEHQHLETATCDRMVVALEDGKVSSRSVAGTPWEDSPDIFERGA
jgi:hypothetical protein